MKIGPIIGCIFIFLMFAFLLSMTVISVMEAIENVVIKIRKRKHKKIIKKLKEEAEYGKICADILRNKIIESKKEEKNDRN